MSVIFNQVFILLIFLSIGFLLGKTGTVNTGHTKILSKLLVYVFLSSNIFKTFSSRFSPSYIAQNYRTLLASAVVLITLVVAAHFAAKLFTKSKYERCIYEYTMIVPNYGYMGYALSEALFGQAGLINFMTFAVPVSLFTYTFGFAKLTKSGTSFKKLCNPVIVATVLGIIVGLTELPIPGILLTVLDKASACMAPVGMLMTGVVISGFSFKSILSNKRVYVAAVLRLIVLPLIIGLTLSLFADREMVQTAVLFYALPCGLNTVIFPKLVDENCEIGAGLALVTTVLSCITLPFLLTVL